jgi:hypothetical protein
MSVYYEPDGGDKDSRDILEINKLEMLRSGADKDLLDDEKLNKKLKLNPFHSKNEEIQKGEIKMGKFEKHTKGLGRRLLEKSGWKEGDPIGNPARGGLVSPLDASDGKTPLDKTGIGFHGEKVDREKMIAAQKRKEVEKRRSAPYYIATKYDKEPSKPDSLLRRNEYPMKHKSNE